MDVKCPTSDFEKASMIYWNRSLQTKIMIRHLTQVCNAQFYLSRLVEDSQIDFVPGAFACTENNLMLVRRLENYPLISDSSFIKPTPIL